MIDKETIKELRKSIEVCWHSAGKTGTVQEKDELAAFDSLVWQAEMSINILQLVIDQKQEVHVHPDEQGRLTLTVIDDKTVLKANLLNRLEESLKEKNTVYLNQTNEGAISIDVSGVISEHADLVEALKVVQQ